MRVLVPMSSPLFRFRLKRGKLELVTSTRYVDLHLGDADVAVRIAPAPDPDLVGRRIGDVVVGIYGTLSYMVAQRTREIGLHIAVGAPPKRLRAMIVGHVGRMAAIGAGLSMAAACDYLVSATDAQLACAFLRMGLLPDALGFWVIPRRVGLRRRDLQRGQLAAARVALALSYALTLLPIIISVPAGVLRGAMRVKTVFPAAVLPVSEWKTKTALSRRGASVPYRRQASTTSSSTTPESSRNPRRCSERELLKPVFSRLVLLCVPPKIQPFVPLAPSAVPPAHRA